MDQDLDSSVRAFDVHDLEYTVSGNTILRELSVSVHKGEVLLIAGPSGSGKSTFLKLLVRLLDPSAGSIHFLGNNIEHMAPPELRRRAVYVPQAPALGPVTVEENLRLGPAFKRCEIGRERVLRLLGAVRLPPEYAQRNTRGLSGGEQYRLSLAMALALNPEVLLLDEPTASLDPELADHVGSLIGRLIGDRAAVIVASHDMKLTRGLRGTYVCLDGGRVQRSGDLNDLDEDFDSKAIWNQLTAAREEHEND